MTVAAAAPRGGGPWGFDYALHFTTVNTSQHISLSGATDKQPAGATDVREADGLETDGVL